MSRGALLVSLVLHASFLTMLGRWWPSAPPETGSGNPNVAVSFLSDDSAAAPRSAEPTPAVTEPNFTPPAPAVELPAVAMSSLPAAPSLLVVEHESRPVLKPQIAPAKNPTGTRVAGASGGKLSHPRGASGGAGNEGASSAVAGYVPPQFRVRYKPPYPPEALAQRWEGTVLLLVSVDTAGRVTHAAVRRSCGHVLLDRSALDSVRTWKFEPARQNGLSTAAEVEVPVRFCFS